MAPVDDQNTIQRSQDIDESLAEMANYRPGKDEREARRLVWDRYTRMQGDDLRKEAELEWIEADKNFRMWTAPKESGDWRANFVLPDAFSAVQADAQEKIARKSRPLLRKVEDSDQAKSDLANAVMNCNMDRTNFDYQLFLARYSAAIRGTAFTYDYYRVDEREVDDPTGVNPDGTLQYTKKTITDFDDDYSEWIANEFILVDERVDHIDKAVDMCRLEILNVKEFHRVYGFKKDFMNVDKVRAGSALAKQTFFRMPEDSKPDDVLVIHYFNRALDYYYALANNVMVRMGPIPFKHKELPVAVHYHYYIPGRLYGMGIPKIIESLTEERRAIRMLNIDRQKMHLNKMFLVDDRIDMDEEEAVVRPHGFIEINTGGQPIGNLIQPLEYGDVPASYFRTEEILLEDIRRAHGIDDRIQGNNLGGTATEAAILKESSLKRVNMIAELAEMDTIKRIGKLKWSNIQFFYPAGRVERLFEDNKWHENVTARRVTVDGKEFKVVGGKLETNDIDGASVLKLDKSMAKFMDGEFDVIVDVEAHQTLSKPIRQAKTMEMVNTLASNPLLFNELDPRKAVKEVITENDMSPRDWMKDQGKTKEDWQLLAAQENDVMLRGEVMLQPTEGATTDHTLVHLHFAQTPEYQNASQAVKHIVDTHILGEHDANPTTGASADLFKGGPGAPPPGVPGAGPLAPGPTPPGVQIQPADLTPSTVTGQPPPNAQGGNAPISLG